MAKNVIPSTADDRDSHECRSCFGYGHFDQEGRVTISNTRTFFRGSYPAAVRTCADCGGSGFVKEAA